MINAEQSQLLFGGKQYYKPLIQIFMLFIASTSLGEYRVILGQVFVQNSGTLPVERCDFTGFINRPVSASSASDLLDLLHSNNTNDEGALTVTDSGRNMSPSNFSSAEKTILRMDKLRPIPIASDATRTSYLEVPELNSFACSRRVSGGKLPLHVL